MALFECNSHELARLKESILLLQGEVERLCEVYCCVNDAQTVMKLTVVEKGRHGIKKVVVRVAVEMRGEMMLGQGVEIAEMKEVGTLMELGEVGGAVELAEVRGDRAWRGGVTGCISSGVQGAHETARHANVTLELGVYSTDVHAWIFKESYYTTCGEWSEEGLGNTC